MNNQLANLLLLGAIYLALRGIASYFEKLVPETGQHNWIGLVHYILLGYFSARYWLVIIGITILSDIYQLYNYGFKKFITNRNCTFPGCFIKQGFVQALSIRFIGLVIGIFIDHLYPARVNLFRYFRKRLEL